jgi:hypothetical protein
VGSLYACTAVACNAQGYVFAGIGSSVRRSTNDGVTWTSSTPSTQIAKIADIAFELDTVYVATGVGSGFGTSRGVYRSTNNGTTWAEFNTGLTNLNVTTITARESLATFQMAGDSVGTRVLCGTWGSGAFRIVSAQLDKQGGDNEWAQCGPSSGQFKKVKLDPGVAALAYGLILGIQNGDLDIFGLFANCEPEEMDPLLYESSSLHIGSGSSTSAAATFFIGSNGEGIYRATNITSVEQTQVIPKRFLLEQNYPNPFNPETIIKYQIPSVAHVTIKVYNLLGQEIVTLVHEEKGAGTYSVRWGASGSPSGVYLYRLQSGNYVETKKILLLR